MGGSAGKTFYYKKNWGHVQVEAIFLDKKYQKCTPLSGLLA